MAITYKWVINNTTSYLETNEFQSYVITSVNWTLTASDRSAYAAASGKTLLDNPNAADFTPYNDVTADQLVAWVQGALGETTVETMKAALAAQIAKQLNVPLNNLPLAAQMS